MVRAAGLSLVGDRPAVFRGNWLKCQLKLVAEKTKSPESFVPLLFPTKGLEVTSEFSSQPQQTTSQANNVRGFEPTTGRERGGQRPGVSRYLPQLATAGKIQHLNFIVDPQADALIADIDDLSPDFIDDPSTNNNVAGRGPRNNGRRVRRGGSGRQSNRNKPSSSKKTPIITWPDAADIWLGTALGGTQLNAQATDPDTFLAVPGSFTYNPAAGAFLGVHTSQPQDLRYTFTPTNTTIYNIVGPSIGSHITVRGIYLVNHVIGSFTVQTGDLVLIGAGTSHTADGVTVTVSDGSNTYTQIGGYVRGDNGSTFKAASLWYFIAGSPGTLTVTITPSAGTLEKTGQGHFRGVLGADSSASGSGNGTGEAFTAGTCPVNFDDEMVAMFFLNGGSNSPTTNPNWSDSVGLFNIHTNARLASIMDTGTAAPVGGTSVSVDVITAGTANGPWAAISASFTHRIS